MAHRIVVLVGTTKGAFFFHSDADRESWRMTGPHLPGWEIYSLLGDDRGEPTVWAGTSSFVYGPTIRRSQDWGETWEEVQHGPSYDPDTGFTLKRIWQLVHGHESQPETMYAGVEEAGVFRSTDGGESWHELDALTAHPTRPNWFPGNGGLCLHTILVDPRNADRIWVAASAVGVFRSTDGGASWQLCTNGLPSVPTGQPDDGTGRCVHKMALDPTDSNTLYMQFHGGVFVSRDGADLWQPIEAGLPSNFGFPMAISDAGTLFVAPLESDQQRMMDRGRLRVYRSEDHGASWQASEQGLPADQYVGVLRDALDVDHEAETGVYFGTTMGQVFWSRDSGETWAQMDAQLPRITCVKTWTLES